MTRGNILVLDDDALVREALDLALSDGGFVVTTAASVGEALRVLADGAIELVVSDMQLQGAEDGAAIVAVRRLYPRLPIVAMSGGGAHMSALALERGASAFLSKPCRAQAICVCIDTFVQPPRDRRVVRLKLN